jgi:hypothetical protein
LEPPGTLLAGRCDFVGETARDEVTRAQGAQ